MVSQPLTHLTNRRRNTCVDLVPCVKAQPILPWNDFPTPAVRWMCSNTGIAIEQELLNCSVEQIAKPIPKHEQSLKIWPLLFCALLSKRSATSYDRLSVTSTGGPLLMV